MNLEERIEDILSMGVSRQRKAIADLVNEERLDELKTLKAKHTRIYYQKVTDNQGNVYDTDSHSYISAYETQERIAKLQTLSQGGKDKNDS